MSLTMDEMLAQIERQTTAAEGRLLAAENMLTSYRSELAAANSPTTTDQTVRLGDLIEQVHTRRADIQDLKRRAQLIEREKRDDEEIQRLQSQVTPEERQAGDGVVRDAPALGATSGRAAAGQAGAFVRASDRLPATVARGQSFASHAAVAQEIQRAASRDQAVVGQHGSLGQLVRSMSTSSGSAIVPTVWSSEVIDKARNLSAVLQAGAQIVPMDAKVVQIGRLTGDPTAAFRAEGSAITASDPTFDNVTLTATTMSALVIGSLEWFQDAENADQIVENAIAQAMASQLDLAALYGGITTGAGAVNLPNPPSPKGLLAQLTASAASSILGAATNGTTQTAAKFYDELLDTVFTPKDFNEAPNAVIWNSKLARMYAKAYDSTYQPLRRPADLDALAWFTSNQIPSYTQGTMTNVATDVFAGDFSQLLIGQRLDLQIQTLVERYADNGQIGIVATWRGDVGIARPRAFSIYRGLKGSA